MARCTLPAAGCMALGCCVMFLGFVIGPAIMVPSATNMINNIEDLPPALKQFNVNSTVCQGINLYTGVGIFYNDSEVKTACENISVKVTFTATGSDKKVPVEFHNNCTNARPRPNELPGDDDDDDHGFGPAGQFTSHLRGPPQEQTSGGMRQRGTFFFLTESTPGHNGEMRASCLEGTYHVEASDPVTWIDMNRLMMAALGGLIGLMTGMVGLCLSCCCGLCCMGAGGVLACTAQSPVPAVHQGPLLAGQDAQMRTMVASQMPYPTVQYTGQVQPVQAPYTQP